MQRERKEKSVRERVLESALEQASVRERVLEGELTQANLQIEALREVIEWLKARREHDAIEADFMRKRVIELEHGSKAEESEAGCGNRQTPASPLGHPPPAPRRPRS
jgi:hypothetical protein